MDKINKFFRNLSSRPLLLWKFGAPLLFITLAFVVYFSSLSGLGGSSRILFSGLLLLYGGFRLFSFYNEYKNTFDE